MFDNKLEKIWAQRDLKCEYTTQVCLFADGYTILHIIQYVTHCSTTILPHCRNVCDTLRDTNILPSFQKFFFLIWRSNASVLESLGYFIVCVIYATFRNKWWMNYKGGRCIAQYTTLLYEVSQLQLYGVLWERRDALNFFWYFLFIRVVIITIYFSIFPFKSFHLFGKLNFITFCHHLGLKQ